MEKLRSIERGLAALERAILTGLLVFMVSLAFLQVVLRQVGLLTHTGLSLLWGDTLLRHLVLWVGFLGACVAAQEDKQFAMDAAAHAFAGRTKSAVAALTSLFTACVSLWLALASLGFFREERVHSSTLFSIAGREVPGWPFAVIVPLGFALLAVHYLLKTAVSAGEASGTR